MALSAARFTRATDRLAQCALFYREIVGLAELFAFTDHAGYSGYVFGLPGAATQLELVHRDGAPPAPAPDAEHAVVLYARGGFEGLRKRLADHAIAEVVPDNPYWVAAGAFAVLDPDGWMLIVVPAAASPVGIEEFTGDRAQIAFSFRLAEDSEQALAGYLGRGRVWVARTADGRVVGHIQAAPLPQPAATGTGTAQEAEPEAAEATATEATTAAEDAPEDGGVTAAATATATAAEAKAATATATEAAPADGAATAADSAAVTAAVSVWEIVNTAVAEDFRGAGLGRRLIEQVVAAATAAGVTRLEVATGAADIGNLRFYQRCGFRMSRVVADVFTPEAGYPEGLEVEGIPLRDQVWFTRML
ncbi:GNAT family N-acetyltransferase [Nocardia yunnanensis]|uniref:GNAT family N-acetyltransferase n=1 Tax=Nocardia yunnanensis TaxID=2382165 RepID=A0A386ZDX7_9NOCA|nr:GNAT family N-acetyltransferase [Nocardia yunnanensis]